MGDAEMGKKIICLAIIMFMSFSLIGCAGKKPVDLTSEQREFFESLTKMGVYHEVYSKYGLEPGITIENITAYDDSVSSYYHMVFYANGSYAVMTESNELYSGTFKFKGYYESHGAGTKSCEITAPKNGLSKLPEKSPVSETDIAEPADSSAVPSETAETTLYQPFYVYINENIGTMGTIIEPPFECDVNRDGHAELCSVVITGSGVITSLIVVYDVQNDKGYMLNDRGEYDYDIIGASEDEIAVRKTVYQGKEETYGTLSIQGDELIFNENAAYGATLPVST